MTTTTTTTKPSTTPTDIFEICPPSYDPGARRLFRYCVEKYSGGELAKHGPACDVLAARASAERIVRAHLISRTRPLGPADAEWFGNLIAYATRAVLLPLERFSADSDAYGGMVSELGRAWPYVPREMLLARLGDVARFVADRAHEAAQRFAEETAIAERRSARAVKGAATKRSKRPRTAAAVTRAA